MPYPTAWLADHSLDMTLNIQNYRLLKILPGIWIFVVCGCKQAFFPPLEKANVFPLVVDGVILNGNDSTIINLSRTEPLTDSAFAPTPESGAQVNIIGTSGDTYQLTEQQPGKYVTASLSLSTAETYQLKIVTTSGNIYLSDSIPIRPTPPIDSVSWSNYSGAVHIFVTTHDPTGNTRYYRWLFAETWQYHSAYFSKLVYENGALYPRTPDQYVDTCWTTLNSTNIFVGTSAALAEDLVYQQPLIVDSLMVYYYPPNIQLTYPAESPKFNQEYSILVSQFALTEDAYNYWNNLKQVTEQLGTIFSAEPSAEVSGNVHNISNPHEIVLGYVSASTLQQKRIFINHYQLFLGTAPDPPLGCGETAVFANTPYLINYDFSKPSIITPIDSVFDQFTGAYLGISGAATYCVNCEASGGTRIRPSFWPY